MQITIDLSQWRATRGVTFGEVMYLNTNFGSQIQRTCLQGEHFTCSLAMYVHACSIYPFFSYPALHLLFFSRLTPLCLTYSMITQKT